MSRRSLAVVALALLVVAAGCASPVGPGPDDGDADAPTSTAASAATAPPPATETPLTPAATGVSPTPDATQSVDPGPTADSAAPATPVETAVSRESPWGDDPIVVGVAGDPAREYAPLVRDAARFWEANDRRYLGYEVRFEVRPDAANPDVRVNFSDRVPGCGGASDAAGCAPYITDSRQIRRPVPVWVLTGLSDASTTRVVKHEFGHLLGLGHDDPPGDVMNASAVLYTRPQTNATDRAFPWNDSTFAVYADFSAAENPDAAREQLDRAFAYYEAGAPGMPDDLTFRYVDDPAAADVVVEFANESACGGGVASCAGTRGTDPDGDGAAETYTRVRVTLADVPTDAAGWHVGYWLAHALGAEDDGEKPPPFRDASASERRGEWWE